MKKALFFLSLLPLFMMAGGCTMLINDGEGDDGELPWIIVPSLMSTPDGPMSLSGAYHPSPSDVPGCFGVISHTNGKDVYTSLWLSFYVYDTTPVGQELNLERLSFGAALSSNINEYTHTFTGKMILKKKTDTEVVIEMKDVHFKIAHGEYILNGMLTAKR